MDSLKSSLNNVRGRDNLDGGRGKEASHGFETQHIETQPGFVPSSNLNTTKSTTAQQSMNKVNPNDAIAGGQRKALPTGRPTTAAQNSNEALLGSDSVSPEKPAFTRGISVIDQTAVTSTAPTPAGEIQNPMSFGMGQSMARQRESHLPDEDLRQKIRTLSRGQPLDGIEGDDEFGDDLSRQETEKGR